MVGPYISEYKDVQNNDSGHITEAIKSLHWLPIEAKINFKIIMLTWKAPNNIASLYKKNLLKVKEGLLGLCSNNGITLEVPATK